MEDLPDTDTGTEPAAEATTRAPHRRRPLAVRVVAYALAVACGPLAYWALAPLARGPERLPAGMIQVKDLPVYYHGQRIGWPQANSMYKTRPNLVMDIDVRTDVHRVVVFDSDAEHTAWLCKEGYQHSGC